MAFAADSGQQRWQTDLDVGVSSGLSAVAGHVYLGTRNGEVLALNQANGDIAWRAPVSSEVLAPPQPSQQLLVVQSVDGTVTALDRHSGQERWVYRDRKSTRLNSSHVAISYAVFCLKK